MARNQRFTIFDIMEARGDFASNPANPDSRGNENQPLYKGPVPYPRMFYHPEGQERILVPGEVLTGANGAPVIDWETNRPKIVGEQRELVWKLAQNADEEAQLRAAGWHDHPAKALAAAGKPVPAVSSDQRIRELEAQAKSLQDQLALAKGIQAQDSARVKSKTPAQGAPLEAAD